METHQRSKARKSHGWERQDRIGSDLIVPNPKLKLLDQVSEVMPIEDGNLPALAGVILGILSHVENTKCDILVCKILTANGLWKC